MLKLDGIATFVVIAEAGSLAAFLHGAAAVQANPDGPVTATDVARALPGVVADFLAGRLERVADR